MPGTVSRKKRPSVKARADEDDVTKARRLLAGRHAWLVVRDNRTGYPYLVVRGDHGSHTADLLTCSCQRAQFLPGSIDRCCTHSLAVRLWFQAWRTGQIDDVAGEPHRRLKPDDVDRFAQQDLALANVADSLLTQHETVTSSDVPEDDAGLRALVTRDVGHVAARQLDQLADHPDQGDFDV